MTQPVLHNNDSRRLQQLDFHIGNHVQANRDAGFTPRRAQRKAGEFFRYPYAQKLFRIENNASEDHHADHIFSVAVMKYVLLMGSPIQLYPEDICSIKKNINQSWNFQLLPHKENCEKGQIEKRLCQFIKENRLCEADKEMINLVNHIHQNIDRNGRNKFRGMNHVRRRFDSFFSIFGLPAIKWNENAPSFRTKVDEKVAQKKFTFPECTTVDQLDNALDEQEEESEEELIAELSQLGLDSVPTSVSMHLPEQPSPSSHIPALASFSGLRSFSAHSNFRSAWSPTTQAQSTYPHQSDIEHQSPWIRPPVLSGARISPRFPEHIAFRQALPPSPENLPPRSGYAHFPRPW